MDVIKRQAYGFRDLEFFKLKILALHNAKYALVGWTQKKLILLDTFSFS